MPRSSRPRIEPRVRFGATADGTTVDLFTLENSSGSRVAVINYGARIVALETRDRSGNLADIVLGFDSLGEYLGDTHYIGAMVGRYAGRISRAQFVLDGRIYRLAANAGLHHLHGGTRGFDKVVWDPEPIEAEAGGGGGLVLRHTSPVGDEGYPGTLKLEVRYRLTDRDELAVEYRATTDAPTPINLTQHSYFNLAGRGDILGHQLMIDADQFIPVDAELIPTGAVVSVSGTPFDFRESRAIGARIRERDPQLEYPGGYDHTFVVRRSGPGLVRVVRVEEPNTRRILEVFTTEPGLQLYTGNQLAGVVGKGGKVYGRHAGLCLETQHFPNSPNHPDFPPAILRPGELFRSRTVFRFGVGA